VYNLDFFTGHCQGWFLVRRETCIASVCITSFSVSKAMAFERFGPWLARAWDKQPVLVVSCGMGLVGPLLVAIGLPIRRRLGYEPIARIPSNYPRKSLKKTVDSSSIHTTHFIAVCL
jgi:hypothetical protein